MPRSEVWKCSCVIVEVNVDIGDIIESYKGYKTLLGEIEGLKKERNENATLMQRTKGKDQSIREKVC